MSFTNAEGRSQILDDTAVALAALDVALNEAGEAYEHLDERAADVMEATLFKPLQSAYATLKRARSEFAARYGLTLAPEQPSGEPAPRDPRDALDFAGEQIESADEQLAELQDSMLPVQVGDVPLRDGLSAVRRLLAPLPAACESLVRGFGR